MVLFIDAFTRLANYLMYLIVFITNIWVNFKSENYDSMTHVYKSVLKIKTTPK